jgi:hypothetical protein
MNQNSKENTLHVLIVGRHQEVLDRVLNTLRELPVQIDGALTDEQVVDFLSHNRYDVISIGGGVDAETRSRIQEILTLTMPDIQVIEVPRPGTKSIDVLAKKPIQMDGPDELFRILSGILKQGSRK